MTEKHEEMHETRAPLKHECVDTIRSVLLDELLFRQEAKSKIAKIYEGRFFPKRISQILDNNVRDIERVMEWVAGGCDDDY